jgi:hypothetical protein
MDDAGAVSVGERGRHALLYERLSGTSPFAAGTATDIIVAVLTREPPPLTKVPPAVGAVVSRALQKDRAQRCATAAELLLDTTFTC